MRKHISAAAIAFFAIAAVVFFSCRQNDDAYKYMSETLHKYIGNELEIPYNYHLLDREYGLDFYDAD